MNDLSVHSVGALKPKMAGQKIEPGCAVVHRYQSETTYGLCVSRDGNQCGVMWSACPDTGALYEENNAQENGMINYDSVEHKHSNYSNECRYRFSNPQYEVEETYSEFNEDVMYGSPSRDASTTYLEVVHNPIDRTVTVRRTIRHPTLHADPRIIHRKLIVIS